MELVPHLPLYKSMDITSSKLAMIPYGAILTGSRPIGNQWVEIVSYLHHDRYIKKKGFVELQYIENLNNGTFKININQVPVFREEAGLHLKQQERVLPTKPYYVDIDKHTIFNGTCKPNNKKLVLIYKKNTKTQIGYVHPCYLQPLRNIAKMKPLPLLNNNGRGRRHFDEYHNASPDMANVLKPPPTKTKTTMKKTPVPLSTFVLDHSLSRVAPMTSTIKGHGVRTSKKHNVSSSMAQILDHSLSRVAPTKGHGVRTSKKHNDSSSIAQVLKPTTPTTVSTKTGSCVRTSRHHNDSSRMKQVLKPTTPTTVSTKTGRGVRTSRHHNDSSRMKQVLNSTTPKTPKTCKSSAPLLSYVPLFSILDENDSELSNSSQLVYPSS